MIEDMRVRGFGEKTRNDYILNVRAFACADPVAAIRLILAVSQSGAPVGRDPVDSAGSDLTLRRQPAHVRAQLLSQPATHHRQHRSLNRLGGESSSSVGWCDPSVTPSPTPAFFAQTTTTRLAGFGSAPESYGGNLGRRPSRRKLVRRRTAAGGAGKGGRSSESPFIHSPGFRSGIGAVSRKAGAEG
jgi:hypothetical protein